MRQIFFSLLLFLLISIIIQPISVSASTLTLNGYFKSFFIGFKMPTYNTPQALALTDPASGLETLGAVNNRLRLKLLFVPSSKISLHASYDFSPRIQDPLMFNEALFASGLESQSYRFDDFSSRLYPSENEPVSSFGIYHNLDRLFVTLKTKFADIFIGRQAIAWGSSYVINPTDVVAPFTFNELDTEERKGVDALRIRIPLGMMDELDIGYIFGKDFESKNSAFYIRGKVYLLKTDLMLLAMKFRQNLLLGIDVSRSIGGAGFRFETAYVKPNYFNNNNINNNDSTMNPDPDPDPILNLKNKSDDGYIRTSLGLDYNFSGSIYGFLEYHYNSSGKNSPEDYINYLQTLAFTEGTAYLMGKHYLSVGVTCQISPLIPFTGMILYNASDGSFSLSPAVEYNIAENIYISAGAYLGIGKRPDYVTMVPQGMVTLFNSEFGAYPHMLFTTFRIYF
jgi:hypothetical protein